MRGVCFVFNAAFSGAGVRERGEGPAVLRTLLSNLIYIDQCFPSCYLDCAFKAGYPLSSTSISISIFSVSPSTSFSFSYTSPSTPTPSIQNPLPSNLRTIQTPPSHPSSHQFLSLAQPPTAREPAFSALLTRARGLYRLLVCRCLCQRVSV